VFPISCITGTVFLSVDVGSLALNSGSLECNFVDYSAVGSDTATVMMFFR